MHNLLWCIQFMAQGRRQKFQTLWEKPAKDVIIVAKIILCQSLQLALIIRKY